MWCALSDFIVTLFYKIIITEKPLKAHLRVKKKSVISLEVVSCCDKVLVVIDTMDVACTNRDSVDDEAPVMLQFLNEAHMDLYSGFSRRHKITGIGIIANLIFRYICSFPSSFAPSDVCKREIRCQLITGITFQGYRLYLSSQF